jgi:uncharacterized protein (TIGR03000 family)
MRTHGAHLRFLVALLSLGVLASMVVADGDAPARLQVHLPAAAKLMVDGTVLKSTGPDRTFLSPALPSGKVFAYKLTATWEENGQPKTATREALVRAGQETRIDFTAPEPTPADKPMAKTTEPEKTTAKTRTFEFVYRATVTGLPEGTSARIWLPVASTRHAQDVEIIAKEVPEGAKIDKDKYGNHILYAEAKAGADGTIPLSLTFRVTRHEVKGPTKDDGPEDLLPRYLEADRRVPIDGKPLDLLKGKKLPKDTDTTDMAHALYDIVNGHMKYEKKGTGWGNGDSVWACENGYGNCTDFHSLFISLARSKRIPAKFEIGFPLPVKHGAGEIPGYHCWAKFKTEDKGWVAVDISEANKDPSKKDYYFGNLTEDRVTFSTGRDLELVPKQDGPPLNYFIYPYVEVDGKPYAADKVKRAFSYKDVETK